MRVGLPEIPLPVGTLLIADLHLNVEDEASDTPDIDGFLAWLACHPAPVLVILGDLFEVWVGAGQAGLPGSRRVLFDFESTTVEGWDQEGLAFEAGPGPAERAPPGGGP